MYLKGSFSLIRLKGALRHHSMMSISHYVDFFLVRFKHWPTIVSSVEPTHMAVSQSRLCITFAE